MVFSKKSVFQQKLMIFNRNYADLQLKLRYLMFSSQKLENCLLENIKYCRLSRKIMSSWFLTENHQNLDFSGFSDEKLQKSHFLHHPSSIKTAVRLKLVKNQDFQINSIWKMSKCALLHILLFLIRNSIFHCKIEYFQGKTVKNRVFQL